MFPKVHTIVQNADNGYLVVADDLEKDEVPRQT